MRHGSASERGGQAQAKAGEQVRHGERRMHGEVVTALDVHLAELQGLRRQLTAARLIEPGERLDVVLRIAASAEQLAHTVRAQPATTSYRDFPA